MNFTKRKAIANHFTQLPPSWREGGGGLHGCSMVITLITVQLIKRIFEPAVVQEQSSIATRSVILTQIKKNAAKAKIPAVESNPLREKRSQRKLSSWSSGLSFISSWISCLYDQLLVSLED